MGGGEMASLIRSRDWTNTPLGPIESWSQSLRTTVSLCLGSNFPIDIVWGPQHTQIYNDGYRVVCGKGHPDFLGSNFAVCWASAWDGIGEPFARALAGETSFVENQRVFIHRNGYPEETFFTFSFSPIRDGTGEVGGLFHPVTETTATMLSGRRTSAVRDLTACLSAAKSVDEVFVLAVDTLAPFAFDLPFVLFYQLEQQGEGGPCYRLVAHTGLVAGTPASPATLDPTAATPWPIADLIRSPAAARIEGLTGLFSSAPCGPYEEPPDAAFAAPVGPLASDIPGAVMIAGVSPRLPMDDHYRGFYDLVAAAVGAGLANARAREDERRRAEALAAIDRAKTAFFSNVSHEFRTPLTLMLGPLEDALAEVVSLPHQQRERLEVAHRNVLRLLRLVNSLLDFSRIEAGRAQAHFEPIDAADLTAALASSFRSACERAGLELVVDCPPLDEPLYVDPDMWEKIVLNLLSNAFKFTLEGKITVALHRAGGAVELVVRDTGVGIPAVELPQVFERFHRIEGQRGRTHEGTGIGLALVQELVKLHGGAIGASSIPEQGTEFRVTIPLGTAHLPLDRVQSAPTLASTRILPGSFVEEALHWLPDQARPKPVTAGSGTDLPPVGGGKARILLADDNADMRAYLEKILTQGGYEVEAVEDGEAALAALQRGPLPDLVLTDVMMPGLDGFALLRQLRADPAMEGILVILLSARAGEEARVEGLAAGADDYLIKPFSARELRARVDGAVSLARHRRDAMVRERDLRAEIVAERGRAALRESEQRLEFALNAGRLGTWELDLATDRVIVSDIGRANFGLGPSDVVETHEDLLRQVHPDDFERRARAVSEAIETGSPLDIEYRTVRTGGHVAWVQVRGQIIHAADGTPLSFTGVSLDVTARKHAEQTRERAMRALRMTNACADVIIHATDEAGMLTDVCQAAMDASGYKSIWVGPSDEIAAASFCPFARSAGNHELKENPGFNPAEPTRGSEPVFPRICPRSTFAVRDGQIRPAHGMPGCVQHGIDDPLSVTVPLISGDEFFGCWVFRTNEPGAFDQEELKLLASLANDLAFGLAAQRNKDARTRLAAMVDSASEPIVGWDLNATVTSWNSAAERLFGYSADEIVGQPLTMLWPPGLNDETSRQFDRVQHGEAVEPFDSVRVAKDGRHIPVTLAFSPVLNAAGGITSGAIFIRDNTARKHAEDARAHTAEEFRTVADGIPTLCWMAEPDGHIYWYNRRWYEYTGTTPVEMEGWGWQSVHDPATLPAVLERWQASLATGQPFEMTFPLRGADSVFRPFMTRVAPVRDADGEIVRWLGVNTDVTEAAEREANLLQIANALRESEQIFHTLTDSMPQIVWMGTPDGLNTYFNKQWVDYTGLTLEESHGAGWDTPFHPDDKQTARDAWNRATRTGETYRAESRLRAADGSYCWFLMKGEPLTDASGQIVKWLGTGTDIDELKSAQEELLQHREHLEERVAARTAELATANQALADTNKELESFSYSVSHDLRAPLRAIDGFSAILLEDYSDKLDADGKRMLGVVREGAVKMARLIDDILDFSRAGRAAMTMGVIDMNASLRSALADLAPAIKGREVEFRIATLPAAYGDAHTIQRVWMNLLDNAIKYTAPRQPAVIEVGVREIDGTTTYFVKDNGVGFDMQYAGKLFGIFQRLHSPKQFAGTGCGLAIVHRIVRRNGGRLWAEAELDHGATFYFVLPST
jgi:PAS domain S-box-containing protein